MILDFRIGKFNNFTLQKKQKWNSILCIEVFSLESYICFKSCMIEEKIYCGIWQYRLWSFQWRDTKLERFLATNQLSYVVKCNHWIMWIGLMGRRQKVLKFDFQSQFSKSKLIRISLDYFLHEFRSNFFVVDIFW